MAFRANNGVFRKSTDTQSAISPWDLFICVAGRPEGIALTRLAHLLEVERERSLIRPLGTLVEDDLIVDNNERYSLSTSKRAQALKTTLSYALAYEYDYNAYFEPDMVNFLRKAYRGDYFTKYDVPPELITASVVARLVHNDLLLVYSYKPLSGKIIKNPFLDGICSFLDIRKSRSYFGFLRKRIAVGNVINERLAAAKLPRDPQLEFAKKILGEEGLRDTGWGLGPVGALIKPGVYKEDTDVFDPESTECYNNAMYRMHANIKNKEPISIQSIKTYHAIAMANTAIAGAFRVHQVQVRNNPYFKTADPLEISSLLEKLINDLRIMKPNGISETLDLAAYLYNQFVYIHPFEDGNSRTARILLAHFLNTHKLPFETIPQSYEVRFLEVTKGYKQRDDDELKYLLEEIFLNHLNRRELNVARNLPDNPA